MTFYVPGARLSVARLWAVALALMLTILPTAARAADCGHDGHGFDAWIAQFKQRAAAQGISPAVLAAALAGVSYDPTVVRLDRSQKLLQALLRGVLRPPRRVGRSCGAARPSCAQHQATLDRIEKRFGVPAPILIAIWGLETNYGAD